MSYSIFQNGRVMNIKAVRNILWNPKRQAPPVHRQLELNLPASKLARGDVAVLAGLRRIRQDLARN